jgi:TetR/AcrR family transcriptional repressor of nem operon
VGEVDELDRPVYYGDIKGNQAAPKKAKTMRTETTTKQDTKVALLEAGMNMMMERGYSATGINDVLSASGIAKGSFYHHFDSKENFAVEIIRFFDSSYSELLTRTLQNAEQKPLQRLRAYCEVMKAKLVSNECRKGCLIGNLSQEMADQSEVLRKELCEVMTRWRGTIAGCIEEGQKNKEIRSNRSAEDLAELFSCGWSGAMMRAKTVKNTRPLDVFIEIMLDDVLKA